MKDDRISVSSCHFSGNYEKIESEENGIKLKILD